VESFEAGTHTYTTRTHTLYLYWVGGGGGVFHACGYQELRFRPHTECVLSNTLLCIKFELKPLHIYTVS
jgi:hypothetical protein